MLAASTSKNACKLLVLALVDLNRPKNSFQKVLEVVKFPRLGTTSMS